MELDKVIITNWGALKEKYGSTMPRIEKAVSSLISADKKRGIETRLVALDDAGQMRESHGKKVKEKDDQEQVKTAVDSICKTYQPDYVLILGAPDIVPHQDLKNPAYDPQGDDDKVVPSDLPYACEVPFSIDPGRFLGSTRVVGRLPDLRGRAEAAYLVSLLGTAARHKARPRADYQKYFGMSAEVWKASTALSLTKIFGNSDAMATCPPKGPAWTTLQLGRRTHFINCHGSQSDPNFYGQRGGSYPVSHSAERLVKKIMNGTVIAAECCYGAELYDLSDTGMKPGICTTYLGDGAYGFLGSSTIAYGPSEGNGQADLICQYFVEEVLNGASLGEAALKARHRFSQAYTHLDPTDLKTLVQFHLMGDPSIHPVSEVFHALSRTRTFKEAFKSRQNLRGTRRLRREKLARTGQNLMSTLGAVEKSEEPVPSGVARVFEKAAKESEIKRFGLQSYGLNFPQEAMKGPMEKFAGVRRSRSVYMLNGTRPVPDNTPGRIVAIVATVQNGELIHMRRLHSR